MMLLRRFRDYRPSVKLESRIDTIRDFRENPAIEKLKVAVASNKGGNAKTTTAANVAAAIHEVVGPSGRTVALIEGNLGDPHIGDFTSTLIKCMDDAPFLRFFQDDVEEGKEGEKLFEALYEVPEHKGFFIGAVPAIPSSKIFLNRKTGPDSYWKLSQGFKQLNVDFTVVDLGTGKNKYEILGFWNPSHVRILSHKVDLEAITDALDLIKTSQLDSTVEEIALEVDRYYAKGESELRKELQKYENLRESQEQQIRDHNEEIVNIRREIDKDDDMLREIRGLIKTKKQEEKTPEAESYIKGLRKEGKGLRSKIKKAEEREGVYLSGKEEKTNGLKETNEWRTCYQDRLSALLAKKDYEIETLFGVTSLSALESYYKTMFGLEDSEGGAVKRSLQFNFSPIILLPNLVRLRDYYKAKRSDGTIIEYLHEDGFSTDEISPAGFYIPEANYVQQSNDDGIPLVWSSASSKRATNRYRELAWKVISHAFEGGL